MPFKGSTKDDSAPTRGKTVSTPGVGQKYRDPISGARKPDEFFSIGDRGNDISAKIERQQRKDARR